jgi:hypothetical protein
MISFLSRWMESAVERDKGPDLPTQYQMYFFQKYNMKVTQIEGEGKNRFLAEKVDGTKMVITDPITYVALFDALEHLGKQK